MLTKVQKWGNSLALRIPKAFAVEAQLENDSLVELRIIKGKIIVTPLQAPSRTLEELLAGITKDNLHSEVEKEKKGQAYLYASILLLIHFYI